MKATESYSPIDVVLSYYSALGERNIEKIIAMFPEELDWYVPGDETIAPWLVPEIPVIRYGNFLNCYGKIQKPSLQ